ncbi:DNA-3-methyladenine glycosylase 2 family protein [Galbitalea sp. SE-J8]|uniref:DNA-3-methyladenine glycosylase family protein n=1 Tax=Galbitalea sp. SE-J8 TaxID=3054952 RepID=UPI00259C714C|nr:DNA-3-methyladenine glycosylase 2 family protein [Galbitalea sp. SE-J8]MDM4763332.1 DNA-3-methyladenine glycosylase 2 family protein [Galbitalea sp. SE-J8]
MTLPAEASSTAAAASAAAPAASSSAAAAAPSTAASARTEYRPAEPVDLLATLAPLRRGAYDPTFRVEGRAVWRVTRTPHGVATLHLEQRTDAVVATAWGSGAEWAVASVPALLGRDDDWSALDVSAHPVLVEARRRRPGLRLTRTGIVWESLVPAILEQKVTSGEAQRAWRTLVRRHGERAPGPAPDGMRACPPASVVRRIPSWELHRAGVTPQRAATLMRAAAAADGLERTIAHAGHAAEARLRTVLGIGVWTAAETLQRSHGDPDRPSVGDAHLPAAVGWVLAGRVVDDDGMLELLAPWAGQRQRVMRLVEATGIRPPRRGPRFAPPVHRSR